MTDLNALKASILEDGIIDLDEVKELETALFDDGIIDLEEIKLLVYLADETDPDKNDPAFGDLFNKCVESRYLQDEESPGAIDASEASEIKELFYGDGNLNTYEKSALAMIKEKATSISPELQNVLDLIGV